MGPSEVQPDPIVNTEFTLLSHIFEKLTVAESNWDLDARIASTMYWTRYDEDWMDWWNGKKYRWEGLNQIEITFPHTPDLQGGELEFIIDYELDSYNGNQAKTHYLTDCFTYNGTQRKFNLYSPYTSSKNAPAQLKHIRRVQACRLVDGKRVVVYDSNNTQTLKGRQHILYSTPLPNQTASIDFEYRAVENGDAGLWQKLPVQIVTGAAYLDSNTVPIGHYEYRLRAYDATKTVLDLNKVSEQEVGADGWARGRFFVTRGHNGVVPQPDLSKEVVQPVETLEHDRWDNTTQLTNVRDATFDYSFNRDNAQETEQGPPIQVMLPEPNLTAPPPKSQPVQYGIKTIENEAQLATLPETLVRLFQPSVEIDFINEPLKLLERLRLVAIVKTLTRH